MAHLRSYGLDKLRFVKDDPLVNLMIKENMGPSREITSQLDLPDAMQSYQEELINMRVPETRPRDDEQGGEAQVRERSRKMMNIMQFGDVRGDTDLAYKPELEQVPQPYRKINENKYSNFQKDKSIHARYACRGEAQKDDMMRHPLGDPKFRYVDTRKYIPGFARTMQKITIEDHEVPLYGKLNNGKPVQQYRQIENSWILQYCRDSCKVDEIKKKFDIKRKQAPRENVENIVEDTTNVNVMKSIVSGTHKRNMLKQDIEIHSGDDKEQTFEKPRDKPTKRYVTFGKFVDIKQFIDMNEKVNNIEKALKKSKIRPRMGFTDVEFTAETDVDIAKKKILPNKPNTFILHVNQENIIHMDESETGTTQKQVKHRKQNRATGMEPMHIHDEYSEKGRKDKEIKKSQIRILMEKMVPTADKEMSTTQKHHKTKQNLSNYVEGHDLSDPTNQEEFGRKGLDATVNHRAYTRIDEMKNDYDDTVEEIQAKSYVNKAKQNRFVHPDTIKVSIDPYADIEPRRKTKLGYNDKKSFAEKEYKLRLTDNDY